MTSALRWISLLYVVLAVSAVPAESRAQFRVVSAKPDGLQDLYFMRCGPGWTGGDGTYSVRLPSGDIAWLSSDSFIGRVGEDDRRVYPGPSSAFVLGNMVSVQSATTGSFSTYLKRNGTTEARQSHAIMPYGTNCPKANYTVPSGSGPLFRPLSCPSTRPCWYWMGDGTIETANSAAYLRAFVRKFEQYDLDGDGNLEGLEFRWVGTDIASIPTLALTTSPALASAPFLNLVMYGSALLKDGSYTYIYGVRDENTAECQGQCMHVARVPTDQLTVLSAWRYYGRDANGALGWHSSGGYTRPLIGVAGAPGPKVAEEFSVTKQTNCGQLATCYLLITHAPGWLNRQVTASYAASPTGPWSTPLPIYTTPEAWTYNAHAHPWSVNGDGMLVSYNINGSDYSFGKTYRPRFFRVKLAW